MSRSEARRLIAQGGVSVDEQTVAEVDLRPEELDGRGPAGGPPPLRAPAPRSG